MKQDELYRVETSYFVCGILVRDKRIVSSAPIMKWAVGKSLEYVKQWVLEAGGKIELSS